MHRAPSEAWPAALHTGQVRGLASEPLPHAHTNSSTCAALVSCKGPCGVAGIAIPGHPGDGDAGPLRIIAVWWREGCGWRIERGSEGKLRVNCKWDGKV